MFGTSPRRNLLPREFEMYVDGSLAVSITTTVTQIRAEVQATSPGCPLEVALPVDDPDFTSAAARREFSA
jgi:hypothetical protein